MDEIAPEYDVVVLGTGGLILQFLDFCLTASQKDSANAFSRGTVQNVAVGYQSLIKSKSPERQGEESPTYRPK